MSIIVGVRVRPFNQREISLNSQLCVKMTDQTTTLIDKVGNEKNFTFDHSFWSHDGYKEREDGYLESTSTQFADQQSIYNKLGDSVLTNALKGYHTTLFAYGQTGSGKSYSMVGFGQNKGIVPMVCEKMFENTKKETISGKKFEINVSMLEIYNERIQDLLIPINLRSTQGLKVRESKTVGVYVEDLTKYPVDSYRAIELKMEEGFKTRTIASTQMNASSSRAHTIIAIEFKQSEYLMNHKVERLSVINLVDLAGSEKISKTGSVGDRLKEGCAINKSLSVLGMVISSLADISSGKTKGIVVPYRDSALTRILQNALGGNSKTLMICAISPSSDNYEETLSTLRYADQAKRIKCHAVINESESDHKIRELQKENDELKKIIASLKSGNVINMSNISLLQENLMQNGESKLNLEYFDRVAILARKVEEYEHSLKANQMIIAEFEKTFEERLKEEKEKQIGKEVDKENDYSSAHLINMNEDPQLAGKLYYNLDRMKELTIGRKTLDNNPTIILNAIGIQIKHAKIEKDNNIYAIKAESKEANKYLFVNGELVKWPRILQHCDRICFGISTFFIFKNPRLKMETMSDPKEEEIDWEFCQKEMNSKTFDQIGFQINPSVLKHETGKSPVELEKELTTMKADFEDKIKAINNEHKMTIEVLKQEVLNQTQINDFDKEELIRTENDKFEEVLNEMHRDFNEKLEEANQKKQEFVRDKILELKERDKLKLHRKLLKMNPNITEINLIAKELRRKIVFKIDVSYTFVDFLDLNEFGKRSKYRINVKVDNQELGYQYTWDLAKFGTRYYLIKDLFQKFYETNEIPELSQENDPFWDPPEFTQIGKCYLRLFSLAYLIDNPSECEVINEEGVNGRLKLNIYPCLQNGMPIDEHNPILEEFEDNPKFLIGKPFYFGVEIRSNDKQSAVE